MAHSKCSCNSYLILIALAISAFAVGTAEFVMAGVLPDIAKNLQVSIPHAGWLMTAYALGVVVSAPTLTALLIHLPRKYTLLIAMLLFTVGNVVSALAPDYSILMIGRILSSFCHGLFFGTATLVAANSVPEDRKSMAISLMFTGLTLANVLGVPMGTFLGQHFGWRSMFWAVSLLGVIGFVGILALIPYRVNDSKPNLRCEFSMFKRPAVLLALAVTAFGFGAVFGAFAFIAPMMTDVTGFAASHMVWILFLFGLGLVIGNFAGGKAADKNLTLSLYSFLILLGVVLFAFVYTAHFEVLALITVFLLGFFGFAVVTPLQAQVMHVAKDAPTLMTATNIAAFNIGIAAGTYFAGLTIHLGLGYTSPSWVGGILVLIALVMQLGCSVLHKR